MTKTMGQYKDLRNLLKDTMLKIDEIYKKIPETKQKIEQNLNRMNDVVVFAENDFI